MPARIFVLNILTVVGARPQFVKAATVSRAVKHKKNIKEVIVHTGQHFDKNMSEVFFEEMSIPTPNYNLNIGSLSHGSMTGKMLEGIERIILKEKPDWVLVYGDTNSTLAGALAASKLNVKVAHVEAGLRSYNMKMPEEQNRILTDRLSTVLFCPTLAAMRNLTMEGYDNFPIEVFHSGDVMYDAALFYGQHAKKPGWFDSKNINQEFSLATIHRAENTDNPNCLKQIVLALNELHSKQPVILPLHPRTRKAIDRLGLDLQVYTVDPVSYFEMIYLLKNCSFVLSDSGGVQKEAYFFEKRCIIFREETEWGELLEGDINLLAGAKYESIMSSVDRFQSSADFGKRFYGSGDAADLIVDYLENFQG